MIPWHRLPPRVLVAVAALVLLIAPTAGRTASTFADSAFQQQWQQGEAITPNFWGPARDGQREPYKEAADGVRLVQYFDKGRMELTNGTVTNGLLATELLLGRIQVGDATFQPKMSPAIPIAGDPDSPGPTYAMLAALPKLLGPTPTKIGGNVTTAVTATGTLTGSLDPKTPATTIAGFDSTTGHNVPQAFADYREMAGLPIVGYAISEPFRTTVTVGGKEREVVVQVFERRVLTYTADNPDAFKVEMGNIGQHYFRWRYTTQDMAATATPSAPAASAAPTTLPAPIAPVAPTTSLAPTATAPPPATAMPSAPPTSTPRPAIAGPKGP